MNKNLKKFLMMLIFVALGVFCCLYGVKNNITAENVFENYEDDAVETNIKVSVIVPVYNTSKYLDEALNSIQNQTLKEMEIICVNDGSKDNSLEILENHQKEDPRIKIINQKNGGVCVARNHGLDEAQGEYVIFCDSDDVIAPFAYEKLYENAKKCNVDVAAGTLVQFYDGEPSGVEKVEYDESKVHLYTCREYENPYYDMIPDTMFMVTKLYRRQFLNDNNLRFKPGVTHYEDGLFNFLVFARVRRVVQDDNPFYFYRTNRPGSAVTEFNAKKVLTASTTVAKELVDNFDIFNFSRGHEWLVSKILDITYNHIVNDTKDEGDKKHFAKIVVDLIDNELVAKRGVKLVKYQQKQVEDLRKLLV